MIEGRKVEKTMKNIHNEICPGYYTKPPNCELSILQLQGMLSTPSLPKPPGPH